jgi:hypothetical protein
MQHRVLETNMGDLILCVDFDGVIHSYTSPWQGESVIPDPPVPGAMSWLLQASKFWDVHVYSSRSKLSEGRLAMFRWMAVHATNELGEDSAKELIGRIKFAHEKPPAFLTIDDRAICFDGDWSKLDPDKLKTFKPWNKR